MEFNDILRLMADKKASDLFITVGRPPCLKIDGHIKPIAKTALGADQTRELAYGLMSPEQREEFRYTKECNFGVSAADVGRFRVSAFIQRDAVAMVLRRIETTIPSFEDLKLPPVIKQLAMVKRGLIIFVGATGTGKSTSLASMLDYRNEHSDGHIICIEDPIEFLHHHKGCIVTQREVGIDTESYEVALKNTLRQAPDVILIGEIRTREVMEAALTFAETGHLVLTTLHANNANQALERILHFFPEERQSQALMDLSLNLKGILAQLLIPRADGVGRRAAIEVLLNTPLASDLIFKGKIYELKELMKRSREQGMITFDQALYDLYLEGEISEADAIRYADSANEVRLMIKLGDNTPGSRARDLDAAMLIDDY
ncbi:MAG TPA: PilT/PilU family type 4a pilus ATPase [Thiolapillus brandeum]|uniref:PilT/PilU family type 4a pilus ATPase n=1 Tax=Thiolapillus brandeum TaxID=1076588 RepID=A0A831KAN0_9GAMM|nr:PilT/PilU family type 4a pilus ATPase [Thiolapillus brandeum]